MEDNASSGTPYENELVDNSTIVERINLDGNSIISTPDKLQFDTMPSVDNLRLDTTVLSVLSEKDETNFSDLSAKTLHKTISDYVGQSYGSHNNLLAQCSYDRSPLQKYLNHRDKAAKRQKASKESTGKSQPGTKQPTQSCPIQICRPGYKPPKDKRSSRQVSSSETISTESTFVERFKAQPLRRFEFKPSSLTLVDSGPVKVRKIQRTGAKPAPIKGSIKENKSSKLRFEYNRKQGSIPTHMQEHLNKFKKPPFRRAVPYPQACFEDIIERLQKLKKLVPTAQSPVKRLKSPSSKPGKTTKSRKPKKIKKRTA